MRWIGRVLPVAMATALLFSCESVSDAGKKNLVIIVVDALRRDHLGVYDYQRDTSPNIDAFAQDAIVFDRAISQCSWTAPSVAALLTSDYPAAAAQIGNIRGIPTFPEWLSRNGYQTAALVANPIIRANKGYGQGFDTYRFLKQASAFKIVNKAVDWIDSRDQGRPFFLYLHFMDVHDPYTPPSPYDVRFNQNYEGSVNGWIGKYRTLMSEGKQVGLSAEDLEQLVALYDAGIAYFDSQFARFIKALRDRGLYQNTLIALTSDHGDELLDHGGIGHGQTVFEELIRVPLFIEGVEGEGGSRYSGMLEMIDLAPTLAAMLDIPLDYDVTGRSFLEHLKQNRPFKEKAFSEVHHTFGPMKGTWYVSARGGEDKVIYSPSQETYRSYDLVADPHEMAAIEGKASPEIEGLKTALRNWRSHYGSRGNVEEPDPETMKALRALGYVR